MDIAKKEPEDFLIWPENEKAVGYFVKLSTQWNTGSMGGFVGLRYESLHFLFKLYEEDTKNRQSLFDDIQIMEFAALGVLNERKKD